MNYNHFKNITIFYTQKSNISMKQQSISPMATVIGLPFLNCIAITAQKLGLILKIWARLWLL